MDNVYDDGRTGNVPRNTKNYDIGCMNSKRFSLNVSKKRHFQGDESNMLCKICLQVFIEPFSTICGHTFCRECISQHLLGNVRCPICETNLDPKKAKIIPNYTAAALVENILQTNNTKKVQSDSQSDVILEMLLGSNDIDLSSLKRISEAVKHKRLELLMNDEHLHNMLLYEFFEKMIEKREKVVEQLHAQLDLLRADKEKVSALLTQTDAGKDSALSTLQQQNQQQQQQQRVVPESATMLPGTSSGCSSADLLSGVLPAESINSPESLNAGMEATIPSCSASVSPPIPLSAKASPPFGRVAEEVSKYRRRLSKHINSLENAYFNLRSKEPDLVSGQQVGCCVDDLDNFSQVIRGMSRYDDMKRLATLNYNGDKSQGGLSIVSSIEFDKDGEYFVVAGVTKMIKIYNYNMVVDYSGDNHYPVGQLQCNSKISNVSWNPYTKNLLASSDYDGTVQLWDTNVGRATRTLREHEKRCWTVQFNNVDPHLMASGSDDAKVKLWSVTAPQSICTIDAKVNVCCVHFSPKSKNYLVFGSADHCVHLYDIRQPLKALNLFRGHRKAVSYVKYCNESEVVSASTDSNLRVWDVNTYKCLQTMRGHHNEKNFVGLATDGNHVVCGSENNNLYLYYKGISEPLMSFDFATKAVNNGCGSGAVSSGGGGADLGFGREDSGSGNVMNLTSDGSLLSSALSSALQQQSSTAAASAQPAQTSQQQGNEFVSAVCWKKHSNVIVAANSQGTTHILQLQ